MMVQANGEVAPIQEQLINNLDKLNKLDGFDMKATQIGNGTTGQPDDLLGKGTGTALQTLILLAQLDAGVDPHNTNKDFNDENRVMLHDLLMKTGFTEEAADAFIETTKPFQPGGRLEAAYEYAASVKVDTLSAQTEKTTSTIDKDAEQALLAELKKEQQELEGGYKSAADSLDKKPKGQAKETVDIKTVAEPPKEIGVSFENAVIKTEKDTPTELITAKQYQEWKNNPALADKLQIKLDAYEKVLDELRENSNHAEVVSKVESIKNRMGNIINEQAGMLREASALTKQLDNFEVAVYIDENGEQSQTPTEQTAMVHIDDAKMRVNVGDQDGDGRNDYKFISKNEVDGIVGWVAWGDDENTLNNGMKEAYAALQESSGYNAQEDQAQSLKQDASSLHISLAKKLSVAREELNTIEGELANADIPIPATTTHEESPHTLPANDGETTPSDNGDNDTPVYVAGMGIIK